MSSYYPTPPNLKTGGYSIFTAVILARNPGGAFGGYKTHFFINPVEEHCGFCRQIPREPYRIACGHLFCQECLFSNLLDLRQPCSQCHAPIRRDDCVLDVQLTKRIADSSISCPFSGACQWVGLLSQLSVHFSACTQVNPLLRSWMLSIQSYISKIAGESGRLERRVDRLSDLVRKMDCGCGSATYENDKRLGWIDNQISDMNRDLTTSPKKKIVRQEADLIPTADLPYSLDIDEAHMTESLKVDLGRNRVHKPARQDNPQTPKREIRFSVYEDHVRKDTGDSDFELDPHEDLEAALLGDDDNLYIPTLPQCHNSEFKKCLHCNQQNEPILNNCKSCGKIL